MQEAPQMDFQNAVDKENEDPDLQEVQTNQIVQKEESVRI